MNEEIIKKNQKMNEEIIKNNQEKEKITISYSTICSS
jgi:hypothetical protein